MKLEKAKAWDYFIQVARVLLAFIFISYGISKLSGNQFGITEQEMAKTIKQTSLFKLSWYLFNHEPFNSFVGISQIIAGLLLLYNRTALIGALMLLPIVINILVIDITFVKITGFYDRLSAYIILILLILYHYKDRILITWRALTNELSTKFLFPLWAYLLLPLLAFILEFSLAIPRVIYFLITDPETSINGFKNFIDKL